MLSLLYFQPPFCCLAVFSSLLPVFFLLHTAAVTNDSIEYDHLSSTCLVCFCKSNNKGHEGLIPVTLTPYPLILVQSLTGKFRAKQYRNLYLLSLLRTRAYIIVLSNRQLVILLPVYVPVQLIAMCKDMKPTPQITLSK